jgi:uncharacterized protein (DUF983 family)
MTEQPFSTANQRPRDLPPPSVSRFLKLIGRALTRRCPHCGGRGIFRSYWSLRQACPHCGYAFAREEGYFLGGYAVNLIVAEVLGLGAVLYLIFQTDLSLIAQEAIAIGAAIGLPVLFYPFSRTLWMAVDLMFDPENREREPRLDELMRKRRQE